MLLTNQTLNVIISKNLVKNSAKCQLKLTKRHQLAQEITLQKQTYLLTLIDQQQEDAKEANLLKKIQEEESKQLFYVPKDEDGQKTIHFFFSHQNTRHASEVHLSFQSLQHPEPIAMTKIGDCHYYTKVTLDNENETFVINYQFQVKFNGKKYDSVLIKKRKIGSFKKVYFCFNIQFGGAQSSFDANSFACTLIENYSNKNLPFLATPYVFESNLLKKLRTLNYSVLLEHIYAKLKSSLDQTLEIYLISLFGLILTNINDFAKVNQTQTVVQSLLVSIVQHLGKEFGKLRKLRDQVRLDNHHYKLHFELGLRNLLQTCSVVHLQFLKDNPKNFQQIMSKINIQADKSQLVKTLKFLIDSKEVVFSQEEFKYIKIMFLGTVKSLPDLFASQQELKLLKIEIFDDELIKQIERVQKITNQGGNQIELAWNEIMNRKTLFKHFKSDILLIVQKMIQDKEDYLTKFKQYPSLLTFDFIIELLKSNIKEAEVLSTIKDKLIFESIQLHKEQYSKNNVQRFYDILIENSFSNMKSQRSPIASVIQEFTLLLQYFKKIDTALGQNFIQTSEPKILAKLKDLILSQDFSYVKPCKDQLKVVPVNLQEKVVLGMIETAIENKITTKLKQKNLEEANIQLLLDCIPDEGKLHQTTINQLMVYYRTTIGVNELNFAKVFENKVLKMICLNKAFVQKNQSNQLIGQIKDKLSQFIGKIKDQIVTLPQIEIFFKTEESVQELKQFCTVFGVTDQANKIGLTSQRYKSITENLRKYQVLIYYMKDMDELIDYSGLTAALEIATKTCNTTQLKYFQGLDIWDPFQDLNSADQYLQFEKSLFFNLYFASKKQELASKILEEGGLKTKYLDPKIFDKLSEEFIFKDFLVNLKLLEAYPNSVEGQVITSKFSDTYFKKIESEQFITDELNLLAKGFKYIDKQEHKFSEELKEDIIIYSQFHKLRKQSLCLSKLLEYCPEHVRVQINKDEDYIELIGFQDFYINIEDKTPLKKIAQIIAQNIKSNNGYLRLLKADFDEIERIVQSKDTYTFCLNHMENDKPNFNELREKSQSENDENQSSIIDDLELLSKDFQTIYSRIKVKFREDPKIVNKFKGTIIFLVDKFRLVSKDKNKLIKLKFCNENIKMLMSLDKTQINPDESTMKIIEQTIRTGLLTFIQDSDEADILSYEIKIPGINNLVLNQEKLQEHYNKGILLISSQMLQVDKDLQEREQEQKRLVKLFEQMLQVSNEIISNLQELYKVGDISFKQKQSFNLNEKEIIQTLKDYNSNIKNHLDRSKLVLENMRNKFYFLNYIQNRRIRTLIDYFRNYNKKSILPQAIFQLIDRNFQEKELKNIILVGNGQKFQHANFESDIEMIGNNLHKNFNDKIQRQKLNVAISDSLSKHVSKGRVAYKQTQHDFEAVETILYYYSLTKFKPEVSQILLCTREITQNDVQIFLQKVSRAQDFFQANQKAVSLIKEMEAGANKEFLLCFVCVIPGTVKESSLDEQIKNKFIQPLMVDEGDFSKILQSMQPHATCIYSSTPGVGKSTYIKNEIENQGLTYKRIPLQGEMSRKKLVKIHRGIFNQDQQEKIAIHYDLHPTSGESINLLLMDLLIFGFIDDGMNELISIPQDTQIYIEISSDIYQKYKDRELFCRGFKGVEIVWRSEDINIQQKLDDKYQEACRFLKAYDEDFFDPRILTNPQLLSKEECIKYLEKYYLSKLPNPNFYVLHNLVSFIGQLKYLNKNQKLLDQYQNDNLLLLRELIKCNYEFSLSSLASEEDQNESQQVLSIIKERKESEEQRRVEASKWSNLKGVCIVITNEGELIPIYKNQDDLPDLIKAHLNKNSNESQINFNKEYSDFTQMEFIDMILEICIPKAEREQFKAMPNFNLNRIVFTKDNFMKLSLIYMRLRAKLPVLLMGETGVGKTAVVQYLSQVLQARFETLDVHAGFSEKKIAEWLDEKVQQAKSDLEEQNPQWTVIFLDEINTNTNIQGILKEVLIDRHLNGIPLPVNMRLIAACNPYKKLPEGQTNMSAGLDFKAKEESLLVYNVKELSLSMHSNLYDYGSLQPEEEAVYIQKLIAITNESLSSDNRYTPQQLEAISRLVIFSQEYTRQKESQWAVSLRDVARFTQLLNPPEHLNPKVGSVPKDKKKLRTLIKALAFCYYYRIVTKPQRTEFIERLSNEISKNVIDKKDELYFKAQPFEDIIKEEQSKYLDVMEIPNGVARNTPLMENVFVIMTCILNKIPLIICGKPGSSKTLAMNLIQKSMRGLQSTSELFQKLPSLIVKSYQGSEHSTSSGIKAVFESAINKQILTDSDNLNVRVVVLIDEIGLAEHSDNNPLKVLHSLLEPRNIEEKIAFVGISNWSLDASKMNRVITLSRPDPCIEDLKESAHSISEETCKEPESQIILKNFQRTYVKQLVETYSQYIQEQNDSFQSHLKNFHGLRDFYSTIYYISNNLKDSVKESINTISTAFQRNFNGKVNGMTKICPIFDTALTLGLLGEEESSDLIQTTQLIEDNIKDKNSRHLLLFTDQIDTCVLHLESIFMKLERRFKVFAGSDFEEDSKREALYKVIKDINNEIEFGGVVVLLDLEDIYQAFYDVLNLNYQEINGQKYTKVAIGSDSVKLTVHPDFKCVLVTSIKNAKLVDPPLLNRFEKQVLLESDTLNDDSTQLIEAFEQWEGSLSDSRNKFFIGLNSHNLTSLIKVPNEQETQDQFERVQRRAIQLASLVNMKRYELQQQNENNERSIEDSLDWPHIYDQGGIHDSLENLIDQVTQIKHDNKPQEEEAKGNDPNPAQRKSSKEGLHLQNLIAHTYSTDITLSQSYLKDVKEQVLHQISSRSQLDSLLDNFLNPQSINPIKCSVLVIYADSKYDKNRRLALLVSLINSQRAKVKSLTEFKDGKQTPKHIIIVLRHDDLHSSTFQFQDGWSQLYIDTIKKQGESNSLTLRDMSTSSIEDLLTRDNHKLLKDLMYKVFYQSFSYLTIPREGKDLDILQTQLMDFLLGDVESANINTCMVRLTQTSLGSDVFGDSQWVTNYLVKDPSMVRGWQSLHETCYDYLNSIIVKPLSYLMYQVLDNSILPNISTQQALSQVPAKGLKQLNPFQEFSMSYLKLNVNKIAQEDLSYDRAYEVQDHHLNLTYPFAAQIHKAFEELQAEFIDQLIENQNLIDEKLEQQSNANIEAKLRIEDEIYTQTLFNMQQLDIYFPSEFNELQIFDFQVDTYLQNLQHLLDPYSENQEQVEFVMESLKLICKKQKDYYSSLINLYTTLWRQENFLNQCYDILKSVPIVNFKSLVEKLFTKVKATAEYKAKAHDLKFLPRSTYIQCLIETLFEAFFPTHELLEQLKQQNLIWSSSSERPFILLKQLIESYPQYLDLKQINIINFLQTYSKELLEPFGLSSSSILLKQAEVVKDNVSYLNVLLNIESIWKEVINHQGLNLPEMSQNDEEFICTRFKFNTIIKGLQQSDQSHEDLCQLVALSLSEIKNHFSQRKEDISEAKNALIMKTLKQICFVINNQNQGIFVDFNNAFQTWIENDLLRILNNSLTETQLSFEHPYVIALCDAISSTAFTNQEEQFQEEDEEVKLDQNEQGEQIKENLKIAIQMIGRKDTPMLKRIQCLAYFKFYTRILCNQFIAHVKGEGFVSVELQQALDDSFKGKLAENISLIRYFIKQLLQQLDIKVIKKHGPKRFAWMKGLQLPDNISDKFPLIYSQSDSERLIASNLINQFELPVGDQPNMQIALNLFEVFYLQSNKVEKNLKDKVIENIQTNANLNQMKKDILNMVVTSGDGLEGWIQEELKLKTGEGDKQTRDFQVLMAFLQAGVVSSQPNSFIQQVVTNPKILSQIYIPFMVASKEDTMYFHIWYKYDTKDQKFVPAVSQITRWRCKNCKQIVVVLDCGQLNNHRGDAKLRVGEMKCTKCGMYVGAGESAQNTERLDEYPLKLKQFYSILETNEALKGYIPFEDESLLDGLRIRNWVQEDDLEAWGESNFRFGQTLLNLLLMSATLISSQENLQYLGQMLELNPADCTRQNIYEIFKRKVMHGIQRLMSLYSLTEEKIIAVFMGIIKNLIKDHGNQELRISKLTTVQGRREYEKLFCIQIIPDTTGNFQKFLQELKSKSAEADYLEEKLDLNKIKTENLKEYENSYFSILRNQLKIDSNQVHKYITHLQSSNTKESADKSYLLLEQVLQRSQDIVELKSLCDIMKWVRYANSRWEGKVKRGDAQDLSTLDLIHKDQSAAASKEGEERCKRDQYMFNMLVQATLIFKEAVYQDGCDEIKLNPITEKSKFQACCPTTVKKNSMGYPLALMIQQLCMKQNNFLASVSSMAQINWLEQDKDKHTRKLMTLKDNEIIQSYIDDQALLEIIQQNSYSDLRYGYGQANYYLLDEINSVLIQQLILNKVFIDYEDDIDFSYSDDGSLFNQYAKIQEHFPQQTHEQCSKIINELKNEKERTDFMTQIRIAINCLTNCCSTMAKKSQAEKLDFNSKTLNGFLRAQKLETFTNMISDQLQIKHLLHLYEEAEAVLLDSLVDRTHLNYKDELPFGTKDTFKHMSNEHQLLLKNILGRLCVRHLTYDEQLSKESILFKELKIYDYNYLYGMKYYIDESGSQDFVKEILKDLEKKNESVKLAHAYSAYQLVKKEIEIEERRQAEKKLNDAKITGVTQVRPLNHSTMIQTSSNLLGQKSVEKKKQVRPLIGQKPIKPKF